MARRRSDPFPRFAAPLAFLLAATIGILLVRSAMNAGDEPAGTAATPAEERTETASRGRRNRPRQSPPPPPAASPPAAETAETATAEDEEATYYTVQAGDTLDGIAIDHGTTVEALLDLNPGIDPRELRVDQRIRVG